MAAKSQQIFAPFRVVARANGLLALAVLAGGLSAAEPKKITYEDDVLPIFRDNCLKCHNPDKLKGDLDLTSFGNALKGGGSGTTLNAGDPDGSQLYKSITHADEPAMPPNAKLNDKDIATIRGWIEGGLLQGRNSKAIAANKPAVDLALKPGAIGKPDGPPPMPGKLPLEPFVQAPRASALGAIATSPWAPVVALASTRQIALYHADDFEFLGVLPFPEGLPCDVKFSRNGKLLLAGGGRGGHSGLVTVWDIATAERIITIGDQFDSVLAADLSADQRWIALGGPDRVLKIYQTKDGALEHRIKKHTDWVTAVEFSPDGKYLASGDRNGGLVLWETESGQELFTLSGHKSAITAITWRADSEMVASASEDGTLKLWKSSDGSALRSVNVHPGGALAARFSADGRLLTAGRDNKVQLWDITGRTLRTFAFSGDLPARVAFTADSKRVIASDWNGRVFTWETATGKALDELDAFPPSLDGRVQQARERITKLQAEAAKLTQQQAVLENDLRSARQALDKANAALADARKELASRESEARAAEGAQHTVAAALSAAQKQVQAAQENVAAANRRVTATTKEFSTAGTRTGEAQTRVEAAKASLAKWQAALQQLKTSGAPAKVSLRQE